MMKNERSYRSRVNNERVGKISSKDIKNYNKTMENFRSGRRKADNVECLYRKSSIFFNENTRRKCGFAALTSGTFNRYDTKGLCDTLPKGRNSRCIAKNLTCIYPRYNYTVIKKIIRLNVTRYF